MYLPKASIESVTGAIHDLHMSADEMALIFLGEKNTPDLSKLVEALRKTDTRFMGGIFPGILHGHEHHSEGAIILRLPSICEPTVVKNLDRESIALPEYGPEVIRRNHQPHYTAIVLVDALSPNISSLLRELFNLLGHSAHYMGGGAGSFTLKQKPCVFSAEGVFQNAAIIGFVHLSSSLGVRHGWDYLAGPVVATRTTQNTLRELNWRNAFEVYREIVERDYGKPFDRQRFFEISKPYAFGIMKEGAEDVLRDPLALNDHNELLCAGDIPENAVLNVLKAQPERLIHAAEQAAEDSLNSVGESPRQCLVADCISRAWVLGERFSEELAQVEHCLQKFDPHLALEGILSLGEISSRGEGYIEFFNKTVVVGVLYHAK